MLKSSFAKSLLYLSHAACVVSLAACTSTSTVTPTDNPDVFSVTANTRGARMSWAGAYRKAVSTAADYCAKRGAQIGTRSVFMKSDGRELQEQGVELTFACRPEF